MASRGAPSAPPRGDAATVRSQHARSASGASLPPPLATTHQRTHRQEPTKRTHPCACPALPPTCAHTHARSLARTPRHAVQVSAALVPQLQQPGGRIGTVTSLMGSMEDNTSGGKYGHRTSKAGVNMVGRSLAMDLKAPCPLPRSPPRPPPPAPPHPPPPTRMPPPPRRTMVSYVAASCPSLPFLARSRSTSPSARSASTSPPLAAPPRDASASRPPRRAPRGHPRAAPPPCALLLAVARPTAGGGGGSAAAPPPPSPARPPARPPAARGRSAASALPCSSLSEASRARAESPVCTGVRACEAPTGLIARRG
jgi:hypothetical protein